MSQPDIDKQIEQARPRIKDVSPMSAYGIKGFSAFNIILGFALFTLHAQFQGNVALVGYIFNYQFWGIIFFATGFFMLYAYLRNNWHYMRTSLLVMVFSKTLWFFALLFRLFGGSNSNLTLLALWGLLTYLQFGLYLYFVPNLKKEVQNGG